MTVGVDMLRMVLLNNFGRGDDDEAPSDAKHNDPVDIGQWKNDCAEVIASGSGGDMTHCYAAFTETDRLIGNIVSGGGGDHAHFKNDCAEVIANGSGGDVTHCYAAFTETDRLIGKTVLGGGGGPAHWKNDCAEVIASGSGGDMTHCYAAFTETDRLIGNIVSGGGGDHAHFKNDCAEVIANGSGGDMTHCYAAFTETDRLIGKTVLGGGGGLAHWKNDCAEVIASSSGGDMTHCYAAFTETDRLIGKTVSGGGDGLAHWKNDCAPYGAMHDCEEVVITDDGDGTNSYYAASTDIADSVIVGPGTLPHKNGKVKECAKGWKDELVLCCALLKTGSVIIDHLIGNGSSGGDSLACTDFGTPSSRNSVPDISITSEEGHERIACELDAAIKHFLERFEKCLKLDLPTHCRSVALALDAQPLPPVLEAVDCMS